MKKGTERTEFEQLLFELTGLESKEYPSDDGSGNTILSINDWLYIESTDNYHFRREYSWAPEPEVETLASCDTFSLICEEVNAHFSKAKCPACSKPVIRYEPEEDFWITFRHENDEHCSMSYDPEIILPS